MLKLAQPESMVQRLLQRGIVTDSRPGKLRLSAHFYNTEEECDQVLDAIAEELG
jgi:selenocysteine lyase/cysteine desulfurase